MIEVAWERPDWYDLAACRGEPPELFYPKGREDTGARRICNRCVVKEDCFEYALSNETYGIWGGYGNRSRQRFRRERGIKVKIDTRPIDLRDD